MTNSELHHGTGQRSSKDQVTKPFGQWSRRELIDRVRGLDTARDESTFVVELLVAAGFVASEKVDEARSIVRSWGAVQEPRAAPQDCRTAFVQWLDTPAAPEDFKREHPFTDPHIHTMYVAWAAAWNARSSQLPRAHRLDRLGDCKDCTYPSANNMDADNCPAQPPAPEWQPIETAPRDGTVILLAANTHRPDGKPRISTGHYSYCPTFSKHDEVIGAEEGFKGDGDECIPSNQECFTHWTPIPAFTPTKSPAP